MPSLPVGKRRCSSLRPSLLQAALGGGPGPSRPVDLLDGKAKRERSDRPGESSLSCRQHIRSTHTSEAEAATERSEGVAGAKRSRTPINSPQAEPSKRAYASSGRGRRPLRKIKNKEGKRDIDPSDLSLCDRAGRHLSTFGSWWFMPGTPVTLSCSPRCIVGSVHR